MAGSVNKVILVGNLGRDPEVRTMQGGDKVATLRIATSETWKDKATGERKERTEWHTVVIFNPGLVDVAERFTRKGSKIYVEGKLSTRKWTDQQGQERWATEVVLQRFDGTIVLLDKSEGGSRDYSGHQTGEPRDRQPPAGGSGSGKAFDDDLDDDVPF
ncbi:MAG: single-stranded DNA-binding protein [Alphaproteobacteria bacterium]|nr:single-stranded DNA-binding protein [Alphaproteobacteria bacterium]